jgi:signal peptidase I
MEPTLHDRQLLAVDLLTYRFREPARGDVVIVTYSGDKRVRFVKRILGVAGDTVMVLDLPIKLEEGQFYVVGDNRDHSTDSRVYGPIGKEQIIGKIAWPPISGSTGPDGMEGLVNPAPATEE